MNTLFIQFYSRIKDPEHVDYVDLYNGFSDTWDLCESKGDLIWMEIEVPLKQRWIFEGHYFIDKCRANPLPIDSGTVYVSAAFIHQLLQVYIWAELYPNIKFVVGGCILFNLNDDNIQFSYKTIPSNIELIYTSVEKYFNVPDWSGKWKLKLPDDIGPDEVIYFNYTVGTYCYWGNCTYCSSVKRTSTSSDRKRKLEFNLNDIQHPAKKIVRIGSPAMTGSMLRELNNLPIDANTIYHLFVRTNNTETLVIKDIERDLSDIQFSIGMEYPVNRVLKLMNKGITSNEILNFIKMSGTRNLKVKANIIIGWNCLIEDDIRELEIFMNKVKNYDNVSYAIHGLYIGYNTQIYGEYENREESYCGPFYLGYDPQINAEQKRLNKLSEEIINSII